MNELDNIIEVMISQHRTLQKDLGGALNSTNGDKSSADDISNGLKQFTADLTPHLQLENEVFYPELLKRMKASGVDTTKTEDFINQMKDVGTVVMAFLGKYKDRTNITDQLESFKIELTGIISALNMRIELEEGGVYDYWEMYK